MLRNRIIQAKHRLERRFLTYNRVEVSRSAILHNFDLFARATKLRILPVLKSNAYGHGLEQVAEILKARRFPYLAVDGYFEALAIRRVSSQPILIMGMIRPENFAQMRYHDFAFVVQDTATIQAMGQTGKRIKLHLELETGMNRHGVKAFELPALLDLIKRYPKLQLEGVMSHLADADTPSDFTKLQGQRFDQLVETVLAAGFKPRLFHIAQTAGSMKVKSKYANAMRLGIGLYGINPFLPNDRARPKLSGLRPALSLISTITRVQEVEPGESVGYNRTWVAKRPSRIGVLPLGYYEGVPRVLSNESVVKYKHQFLPVRGRLSMNHMMIDLTGTDAGIGDEVVVISNNPADRNSVEYGARQYGLFEYESLARLAETVRHVVVT